MADYDFKTLNDKEFEILCVDLLSDIERVRFERFKAGRDSGVDGRYFRADKTEVVLQCKHWANTPTDQLVRGLRNTEQPKLEKLKPARYILAVSNPLSRADKAAIRKALDPYIASDADILGKEDLNDLLRSRPAIEQRHYKLWLCSTAVLGHIINKPIFERSAFALEETIESARKYVTTANHERAIAMLERLGVVIITGEPGVGKTTLAEHICLHYVANGFQFIRIGDEIREAEGVFEVDQKQIFYFDDFLGRNYLEAVNGHEGSLIVQFIRRITKFANKRFVLTSRSTILNQGKVLIDSFRHQNMDRNEFELAVSSLSEMDKARILYNHIWHSSLTEEFKEALYEGKRYRLIIRHKNYNPRLINFITESNRLEALAAEEYWGYIERTLANPADVWDNPFIAQQDDFGRATVLLIVLNGKAVPEDVLAEAYVRYIGRAENAGLKGHREFLVNLRHLAGALINRKITKTGTTVSTLLDLFNPSLGDYVLRRYASDVPTLKLGFLSLRSRSSISTLENLISNDMIDQKAGAQIVGAILIEAYENEFVGYAVDYVAAATLLFNESRKDGTGIQEAVRAAVAFIAVEPLPQIAEETLVLANWALQNGLMTSDVAIRMIAEACEEGVWDEDELKALSELAGQLDAGDAAAREVIGKLEATIVDTLSDSLAEDVNNEAIFSEVAYEDYESARTKIEALIARRLEAFGVEVTPATVDEILSHFDYEYELNRYYESEDGDDRTSGGNFVAPSDGIDDLFDRG